MYVFIKYLEIFMEVIVVVWRVPAANAPAYTAACKLIIRPLVLDVPTYTARCLHVTTMLETVAVKGGTVGREMAGDLAESSDFHATLGIVYMPQICDMGPTALFPLRRNAC